MGPEVPGYARYIFYCFYLLVAGRDWQVRALEKLIQKDAEIPQSAPFLGEYFRAYFRVVSACLWALRPVCR